MEASERDVDVERLKAEFPDCEVERTGAGIHVRHGSVWWVIPPEARSLSAEIANARAWFRHR